jgi:MoaA/NifB/PqqE/SkfB family radical SAM enzyme
LRGAGWRQLFVELTARCNERCVHCYAESSPERDEELGLDEIRAVLDDASALGFETVQLTGGDPLISPHCIEAAEYARQIGIPRIEVYTNGLALRGRTYQRLRELGVAFAFSFYSRDPERHDAITRTPVSHRRTSRAIQRAVQDGLAVRVGTVTMEENRGEAKETRDYLVQLGVKAAAVGSDIARAVGRGTMIREAADEPVERDAAAGDSRQETETRPFGGTAAVGPDGTVYPCIFSRHLPLGSIRQDRLRTILTAPVPVASAPEGLFAGRSAWATRLSCWECQTRSHMLGARLHARAS